MRFAGRAEIKLAHVYPRSLGQLIVISSLSINHLYLVRRVNVFKLNCTQWQWIIVLVSLVLIRSVKSIVHSPHFRRCRDEDASAGSVGGRGGGGGGGGGIEETLGGDQ